jgi:hypothetical protein
MMTSGSKLFINVTHLHYILLTASIFNSELFTQFAYYLRFQQLAALFLGRLVVQYLPDKFQEVLL